MKIAPVARLAVPTGTAAATVTAQGFSGDPETDARRFGCLATLDDASFRGAFEELIVAGVYTVISERVFVLRSSRAGVKHFAVVLAIHGHGTPPAMRAGLAAHSCILGTDPEHEAAVRLRAMLEYETKQRPVFHGMTPEGITYSGFEAEAAGAGNILAEAAKLMPETAPSAALAVLCVGPAVEFPEGLLVALGAASI